MNVGDLKQVTSMVEALAQAVGAARRAYICGNGGSAANANHVCNDLMSCGVRAHSLCADMATVMAIANDYSYVDIFSRQLDIYAEPGDVLIVLSGSGRSPNVLNAIRVGVEKEMDVWAIVGAYNQHNYGPAVNVIAEGQNMQHAEERQLEIGHELLRLLGGKK